MLRKTLLVSLLFVTHLYGSAQPWKMGGGKPPPTTPAPAAGSGAGAAGTATAATSGTSQTGYVYRLKAGKHLQYASLKTETHYFLRDAMPESIFGQRVDVGKLITATIILDRKANAALLQPGIRSFKEYDVRSVVAVASCKAAPPGACAITGPSAPNTQAPQHETSTLPAVSPAPDTALAVTLLYYDSLPRFTRSRLRLFITQDTAILQARIFNRNFETDIATDRYPVTNRNYQSQFEVKKKARLKREESQKMILLKSDQEILYSIRLFDINLRTLGANGALNEVL